jgi:hypothetical protein
MAILGGTQSAVSAPGPASAAPPVQPTPSASHRSGKPAAVAEATGWKALTPAQREALAPLEHDWPSIDPPRRTKWIAIADKFPSMSIADRQRVQERMRDWARLSPIERTQARLLFTEAKQLSPQERQSRWEAYLALPPERRDALLSRASGPQHGRPAAVAPGGSAASPSSSPGSKRADPARAAVKAISPTVVQARPGATTTLMNQPISRPAHQFPGQPTIAAGPGQVNPVTLLPQRGPQSASAAASSAQVLPGGSGSASAASSSR